MNQSRYGVLVSLCLLLLLAGGFFAAAKFTLQAVNTRVQQAIATSTPIIVVPTPTSSVRVSPTPRVKHPSSKPTAAISPTPAAGNQIVISTSTDLSNATTSFPAGTGRYYCLANLPNVPLSAPITWEWQSVQGNNTSDIFPPITFTYPVPLRYGYADGPYQAGHYRCIVKANDKFIGSADFTVNSS